MNLSWTTVALVAIFFLHKSCPNINTQTELVLKMAVFGDHALHQRFIKEHGKEKSEEKLREFIAALLHHTQELFNTLQPRIKLVVVDMQIFQSKLRHTSEKRLKQNMAYYMDMFCNYQKLRNTGKRWNHAILLSGFDLVYGSEDEFSGYSTADSVCRPVSCSIVEATSFKSAYTLAHEIGHALGMRHDNGSNGCHPGCCMMSPVIYSGTYQWSSCSRQQMINYLKTIPCQTFCLLDHKITGVDFISSKLPGQKFSLDDQCRMYLGSCYQHYIPNDKNISTVCESIWCANGENFAKEAHAALEGSHCGHQKWCIGGNCVTVPRLNRRHVSPIDGQWTSWQPVNSDGKCGTTGCSHCSIKHQTRVRRQIRSCSDPSPNNGGKTCTGGSSRGVFCEAKEGTCSGISTSYFASLQCKRRKQKSLYLSVNLTGEGFQNINSDYPCVIWCKTSTSGYMAYTFFDPLPDGANCGSNKVCLSGKCMDLVKCSSDITYVTEDNTLKEECARLYRSPSLWTEWSQCSVTCGVGLRTRTRDCPTNFCPKNMTNSYQWCRTNRTCFSRNSVISRIATLYNDTVKLSSPYQANATSVPLLDTGNEWTEVDELSNDILVELKTVSTKRPKLVTKSNYVAKANWEEWSNWTVCTKSCGGGTQQARRKCSTNSTCKGAHTKQRVCNFKRC